MIFESAVLSNESNEGHGQGDTRKERPAFPNDEFRTVKQPAAFFKMSAAMIYSFCDLKKLGHYRFGEGRGAIRISRADVSDFLKKSRVEQEERGRSKS